MTSDAIGICHKICLHCQSVGFEKNEVFGMQVNNDFCCGHQSKQAVPAKCQEAPLTLPDSAPWTAPLPAFFFLLTALSEDRKFKCFVLFFSLKIRPFSPPKIKEQKNIQNWTANKTQLEKTV